MKSLMKSHDSAVPFDRLSLIVMVTAVDGWILYLTSLVLEDSLRGVSLVVRSIV